MFHSVCCRVPEATTLLKIHEIQACICRTINHLSPGKVGV